MGIALTLQQYLDDNHVPYDVMTHEITGCSTKTAQASHVPGGQLAKGVVLKWGETYLLAIVPATRHVELDKISDLVEDQVTLANEQETSRLFPDCDDGAVPVMGNAYRVAMIVDDSLEELDDVYFEGGDHRSLVHITGDNFSRLMGSVQHGAISH